MNNTFDLSHLVRSSVVVIVRPGALVALVAGSELVCSFPGWLERAIREKGTARVELSYVPGDGQRSWSIQVTRARNEGGQMPVPIQVWWDSMAEKDRCGVLVSIGTSLATQLSADRFADRRYAMLPTVVQAELRQAYNQGVREGD
jgi:hypothetical protein